jgi:signal transduction histidine kinase
MPLGRSLLLIIGFVLSAVAVPAAMVLETRLTTVLVRRAHDEVAAAPHIFGDRRAAVSDAMMMHAKELAHAPGLAEFMASGDRESARRLLDRARQGYGDDAVLVTANHGRWSGPPVPGTLLDATRRGDMPVAVVLDGRTLRTVAVAPVMRGTRWVGAAGVATDLDQLEAERLAGLTRGDVLFFASDRLVASTTRAASDTALNAALISLPADSAVHRVDTNGGAFLAVVVLASADTRIVFLHDLRHEFALLPELRHIAVLAGVTALALALLLGAVLANAVSRPVRDLARAADLLARGDFDVPLGPSKLTEVTQLAAAFAAMRYALQARVRELEERQSRLTELQADLIQRDRLATAGRLVAQLAHEIRNPVANVRNCLELVVRHRTADPQIRTYAEMAIGELLRMHAMAEQLLDLHRPRREADTACDAVAVACEVAELVRIGAPDGAPTISVSGNGAAIVAISPDALKQVLQNFCQNAREAMPDGGAISIELRHGNSSVDIEVTDTGPGIAGVLLRRIFDPFFTTKRALDGVGLGLFVADGIVRSHGGRIVASNRPDRSGARFIVTLPIAPPLATLAPHFQDQWKTAESRA